MHATVSSASPVDAEVLGLLKTLKCSLHELSESQLLRISAKPWKLNDTIKPTTR